MRNIKKFSDFIVEQTGRFGQASSSSSSGQKSSTSAPKSAPKKEEPKTPPAATTITQAEFDKVVLELDGFALFFANKAQTLAKYDETSMSDCDGIMFDDDEACYWKIIWQNWEAEGCPATYTKFAAKVTEFIANLAKYPNQDAAKLVQTRVAHNLHEANRMNQKSNNTITAPAGKRSDTLRGMVMKVINKDDHWFRWTMYYTNAAVTPFGGGAPSTVSPTSTYKVDCDF
jgi:hypothetical protein